MGSGDVFNERRGSLCLSRFLPSGPVLAPKSRGLESARAGAHRGETAALEVGRAPRSREGGRRAERRAARTLRQRGRPRTPPRVPRRPARTLRAPRLGPSTASVPLGAEASEEVMSRAATAPQLQAPQPDISAGPRPGFSSSSSSSSESQGPGSYLQGALTRLRTLPPTPRPGADFSRQAARPARSQRPSVVYPIL